MPGIPVAIIEPGRVIVLRGDTRIGSVPVPTSNAPGDYFATTWRFYLDERDDGTTRLIARFRSDYNDTWKNRLMYGTILVEPISCVMQRKMLLGIQQRAEIALKVREACRRSGVARLDNVRTDRRLDVRRDDDRPAVARYTPRK